MKIHSKTIQTIMSKTKFVLLAFLVAFSFSCSPEDGNDGAPGPAGPTGTNGADGNANVFASAWMNANYPIPDSERKVFVMAAPELTQEVIDSSVILIYGKTDSEEFWGLPTTFPFLNETYAYVCTTPGTIIVLCDASDGSASISTPYLISYRYVIIPSNNTGRNSLEYSQMSYWEVMGHFNLEL